MAAAVQLDGCSKWYGQVLGVSNISWSAEGGVVGLLGPNGAGKSTFIKLLAGLLRPSRGTCSVFGQQPFRSPDARRRIGYSPEHEGAYDDLTGLEFVQVLAQLSGLSTTDAARRAREALDEVGMSHAMNRRIKGYSKGMRQRTKLAQAMVHDPDVILLDEPLTGVDPVARRDIIDRISALGSSGNTVIVSSHILHEIQALTQDILVIYRGQVLAEGNLHRIRELIDQHPHRIRLECDRPRDVAQAVAGAAHIQQLSFRDRTVVIHTSDPDACYDLIGNIVVNEDLPVRSLTSPDNSLSAVFEYLTGDTREVE